MKFFTYLLLRVTELSFGVGDKNQSDIGFKKLIIYRAHIRKKKYLKAVVFLSIASFNP